MKYLGSKTNSADLATQGDDEISISSSAPTDTSILWADTTDTTSAPKQVLNTQTGNYTIVSGDANKFLTINSSSAASVTVNTTTAFAVGQRIDLAQTGTGQVTVVASGVTINGTPGLKLRAQYSGASLFCTASNTYLLIGDLAA